MSHDGGDAAHKSAAICAREKVCFEDRGAGGGRDGMEAIRTYPSHLSHAQNLRVLVLPHQHGVHASGLCWVIRGRVIM